MNPLKAIICLFKGHDIDPDESIIVMKDKRNWLCQCHRCGLYEMHDGAISGMSVTFTKREAYEVKKDVEYQMKDIEHQMQVRKKAYEKGLSDAWDCVDKINSMSHKEQEECFGRTYLVNILEIEPSEAIEKLKAYEHEQPR